MFGYSHLLELVAKDATHPPPIAAIRVFHPAGGMPGTEIEGPGPISIRWLKKAETLLTVWPAARVGIVPEFSAGLGAGWFPFPGPSSEMFGFRLLAFPIGDGSGFIRLTQGVEAARGDAQSPY